MGLHSLANTFSLSLPVVRSPEEEPFATLAEVAPIIRHLDQVSARTRLTRALRNVFFRIEQWIRVMMNHSLTQAILTQSGVLNRIKNFLAPKNAQFRQRKAVPVQIVEDLTYLHDKWTFGDLGVLATRGLLQVGTTAQLTPDPTWPWRRTADFYGHGHLINGQTWCYRAEMMRDGAHAPPIAGISGKKHQGARSVVMGYHDEEREHFYADIDQGNIIYYYGTALPRKPGDREPTNIKDPIVHQVERITRNSKGEGPTHATTYLFDSYRMGRPVRVFRSFKLADIVPHRPLTGFRYDGLYIVTAPELVKKDRQIYRFKMERMVEGQGPLRSSNAPLQPEYRQNQQRKRKREE